MYSFIFSFLILFNISYVECEWEWPIQSVVDDLLSVIGGYPTFISSFYNENSSIPITTEKNITCAFNGEIARSTSPFPWKCSILNRNVYECDSILDNCQSNSQYSFSFWNSGNVTCMRNNSPIDCIDVTMRDDICQNVVMNIHNDSSSLILEIQNHTMNTSIRQVILMEYMKNCSTLKMGDSILTDGTFFSSTTDLSCDHTDNPIFGWNDTRYCWLQTRRQDCSNIFASLHEIYFSHPTTVCSCDNQCQVPIISSSLIPINSSSLCYLPTIRKIYFAHNSISINGAYITYEWQFIHPEISRIQLRTDIIFHLYTPTSSKSRFALQRGRFSCPSEVSCWNELFYAFLFDWSIHYHFLTDPYQISILLLALLSSLYLTTAKSREICACKLIQ